MKKISIVLIVIITTPAFHAKAQTVIAAAGTVSQQPNYSVAWTLGETLTATITNSSSTLTQGFHQVDGTIIGIQTPNETIGISIFPNPFNNQLNIQLSENFNRDYQYSLSTISGNVIFNKTALISSQTELNLVDLPPGVYLLSITNLQSLNTYRIIKTN